MLPNRQHTSYKPEYWGGIECTINRVNDRFLDQLHCAGHYQRGDDIDRIAELGITKLRYPVLWEKHQPDYDVVPEWGYTVQRLDQIRKHNIVPIAGLLHHGSGPSFTNLADDNFPTLFAAYASAVA
ncbi:MAG: glycoside hydrolase, partial [Ginsengibacter sp.]